MLWERTKRKSLFSLGTVPVYLFVLFALPSSLTFCFFVLPNNDRLHVACGVGASTFVVQSLLDCYPEATLMKTTKGSSPLQCLNLTASRNKKEVGNLLKRYYMEVDEKYQPAQKVDSERMLV